MSKKISKYLEENWDELKGKIKQKWGKLTNDDLLQIEGSYDQLVAKLHEIYSDKVEDVKEEILIFLEKYGFGEKNAKNKDISDEVNSVKEIIYGYIDDYFKNFKEKSSVIEEKTMQHVKENPLKWLGVAAVTGFILAKVTRF